MDCTHAYIIWVSDPISLGYYLCQMILITNEMYDIIPGAYEQLNTSTNCKPHPSHGDLGHKVGFV